MRRRNIKKIASATECGHDEVPVRDEWRWIGDHILERIHNIPRREMFVPSDCEDCPCDHRLIQDWRETQLKFQSNVRVDKSNWRLPGDNGERSNNRNEFWTGKSIFRVLRHQEVLPVASCIMDDNLMACVNAMGLDIISPNKIFIPHTYWMMIEENKNDNELNTFADSLINLLLVRDNGQCMKYSFVRSIPDLDSTKYLGKNVTITMQELPESTPTMILMCAEPSSLMTKRYSTIMDTSIHLELITEDDDLLSRYGSAKWRRCLRSNKDCVFFAGPCTGGSPWNRLNKRVSSVTAHLINAKARLYWKLWEEFSNCLLRVIKLDAMALLELPRGCDYWHDERMKCMIGGTESHIHDFDGCMYGLKTQFDDRHIPIKKPWRIVSWGVKFDLHKKCDRRHDHGKCEGRETRITQTYTQQIVDISLKTICRNVSIRFKKSLSNGDDTCSSCMHDRRSIKKTAVSVACNNNEVAADLMWLMIFHKGRCRINVDPDSSGHQATGSQFFKTFAASHSLCATRQVIGNRFGRRRPGVRDLEGAHSLRTADQGIGNRIGRRRPGVREPLGKVAMSNYTQIIGSAQHDLNDINKVLITLRENGRQGVIPAMYKEYDPTINSQPDSSVNRWHAIGISPIAAASACYLGKVPSNRSEVEAITLYLQLLELIKNQEELNTGAKRFLDKCTTYMKTFVQLASRNNHKVLGFCTSECINGLGNMWECIKNFHVPHPIRIDGAFTVSMLRDHLREFKLRPYGGDLRGVNQSVPGEDTWLSATRKKDGVLNPSDPDAPITISFRAIHRELHYFDMGTSWQSASTQNTFNAMLDEWQRQVIHLGHAWRCYNQKVDDEGEMANPMTLETTINDLIEQNTKLGRERAAAVNHFTCILALSPPIFRARAKLDRLWHFSEIARTNIKKIDDYFAKIQQSLMLTSEILQNHGYNVINVEEGNHGEIKKRNKCFSALRDFMTTLSETQAGGGQPGVQVAASGWRKVLRFGDGVWPPEPPRSWVPEWVTIQDPTVPAPRVTRFTPKTPPMPPPGYKAPPQPYPSAQPPPPKARPTSPSAPSGPSASGSQASGSAGPPPPPPQAAPKPAAKPMPRRETPATEYVPPMTPSNVITYCRVLVDYTGTQVRSILNTHVSATDVEFALSHVQGPMANGALSTWRQYLRRVATYTCLCFGLANAREIGEASYPFSDMEWLRIYNAATKRGGLVYQNYYLSVGSMTVMVEKNDDAQATDRNYDKWKRGLMSGIGGTIVDKPMVRKEKDELAGKFRFGKTILITDLNYRCQSGSGGTTNIQYGLDEMGYVVTVIDINSFKSVTRAQKFLDAVEHLIKGVMPDIAAEENVTIHFWISFAFLITDTHPYHVWVERNYAERLAEAIRRVDKLATRPIFVSLCKDPRFHGIRSGIQDVATDSADILRSYGIMVTTDDGMWRLMYGHAGNHYMNNHNRPERLGVFATMEKFLFRQRVLLMCSLNVEAAKGLNDMVKESSMKVGINLELMEDVLKEPLSIRIGTGGGVPDTASTESSCPGTVGGGRRSNAEYEKAPWIEATVRSVLPEPSANMYDMWFYVNHGRDEMILCQGHYNGDDDEVMPTDQMRHDFGCGKECIACRASETMKDYQLWPPEYQRKTIVKTAARSRAFFDIMSESGNPVTDPQKDFVQFLKDITKAMVGNKGCEHGEILMMALSHFGMVRVPRDRIKQIFVGKRGRQYGVIREEFTLGDGTEAHERFAYRVTKDYGNVFYKDYLKMVLGDDFTEVMGYADATAEKCGDVVEMWLGMLDLANMTKSQVTFMKTKADPGELLAGLEASINIFHGTTRSTTTPNTKRGGSRVTEPTNYEEALVNQILRDIPMYHGLQYACLIEDKEISIINENYKRSKTDDTNDENMESEGPRAGEGTSTTPGPTTGGAGANAEGAGSSTTPDMHEAPKSPSNPEEEFQISQDKGAIVEAINALFALADDNNVCLKCGERGHPNYECPKQGSDPVKSALINLRKRLQGDDVEKDEAPKRDDEEEQRFRQENYKATRAGEYMYLQAIPLSVIGDRAHGEKSINGVRAEEKGPMSKDELNGIVDTASQRGITTTCKEMKSAVPYSDHRMYKKLNMGKLKILPVNGGKFYSERFVGPGVEYPLPTESRANRVFMAEWEKTYSYYFNKALRHHIGRKEVWEKASGRRRTTFPGLRCDEAGWVDIMEFLHHPWIFDHEQVKTEDDGLVDVDFRAERVKTMIKTVWSEFQERNKIRIQFLCIVLDSTFVKPDDYLKNVMGVGDDIHDLIAQRGEVFLAPIAVRSPGGFSARGSDFRLDYSKICHPITTKIADDVWFCYHVTEFKNVVGIIKEGLRPGGHRGGRTQVFLNPFVPWDKRYRDILGGQLTHLGQPRMVLAFSVHRLMSLGVMINASGQMVVNGNIPFSEVAAAWYQANNYDWERLVVDSGKFHLVRSCQEPKEIATANTVLRVSKALLNDIDSEDNIPFYDKFVEDVAKLESLNGALSPNSELRNDIVTFISENYTPGEAGHLICPACLTETPNILSICIRCHGSLVSWGEKEAEKDESTAPRNA